MKYLSKFNEAFLPSDKEKAIDTIINYIEKKASIDLNPYDELWHIQKKNLFLVGQLWISLKSSKALRFNWIENDLRSEIHSIDMWVDFEFDSNPDFTLNLEGNSVTSVLPGILKFFESPEIFIKNNENIETAEFEEPEGFDPKEELEKAEKRLKRLKNPKSIAQQQELIEKLRGSIAYSERSEVESEKINMLDDDLKIDVFKAIELNTIQVARGRSNSLIVTGQSGLGKTRVVMDTIESLGMVKDVHYYHAKGTATTAGLYEILFKNRKILIIFDDCDDVLKEADSVSLLSASLDTYETREVSRLVRGYFDSTTMSDKEIQEEYEKTGKLPNRFEFTGEVIFISNLPEEKFDKKLLSRCLHVDVHLSKKEVVDRMKEIMKKLTPDVEMEKKLEALDYLVFLISNYPTKFDLNIRTLIHSINLRAGNEEKMKIGDKEEFVWKLLVKKYLIKTK